MRLIGTIFALGICPLLTGGAVAEPFVWPDSGAALVPAGTELVLGPADCAKIASLDKIVFADATSKVTYNLAADWTLSVPVEGPGTFAFESAGPITLAADNRNLTGAFFLSNTTALVTHEYGLGSEASGTCHFWCGDTSTALPYGHTLDFDDGSPVFTNHVAVWLHPLAGKDIAFGAVSPEKTLVQDADFTFSRYNANQDYLHPKMKGTVKFLRHFEYKVGAWTQYPYMNVTGGEGAWLLGSFRLKSTGLWFVSGGPWHLGYSSLDSTVAFVTYSTARIFCEAPNILGKMKFQAYQMNALFDLNGYDQDCVALCEYGGKEHASGDPLLRFTSATPAVFRITGNESYAINPTFSGAAGLAKAGTGTYRFCNASCDTTGDLRVEAGTLEVDCASSWGGTNVTIAGGTLAIGSLAAEDSSGVGAFFNPEADLVIDASAGGRLSIADGRTDAVRTLTIDGSPVRAGVYGGAEAFAANLIGADHRLDALSGNGLLRVRRFGQNPGGVFVVGKRAPSGFPLVWNGRAAPIVIPSEAEASTELAADELAAYVAKITGVRPAVYTNGYAHFPHVEIGTLNTMTHLPKSLIARFGESPSWESHLVTCDRNVLRIVGRDEVAELYGTYQFLEEQLDVRWFKEWTADDPGDYYPARRELDLTPYVKFCAPDFSSRWLSQTGASVGYCPKRGIEWTARLGLQCVPYGGGNMGWIDNLLRRHSAPTDQAIVRELHAAFKPRVAFRMASLGGGHMMCANAIPASEYFETHPEYFAEVKGVRVNRNSRYCLSNADVQRLVAEDVVRRLDKTGGRGSYLFGLMDGTDDLCECANCQALDDAEAKLLPLNKNISTRFHTVACNIAAQVYAHYPDATLYDWAYSVYRTPPVGVTLDPRTGVQLCIHGRCYGHALTDPNCERNPERLAWLKSWLKVATWGKTYEYANCSGNYYCPLETIYPQDLKYYHELGLRGWGEEMGYTDSVHVPIYTDGRFDKRKEKSLTNWQWFYVAGKLSWDVSRDPEAILADAESKYYGAAYPAMREYQALRRKHWKNASVCWGYGGYPMTDERTQTVLNTPGLKDELLARLDEAEALATNDVLRLFRVRKDREWLQRYWIEPNETVRAAQTCLLRAPVKAGEIAVDGSLADDAWGRARWADGCTPEQVDAGIVSDGEALYFAFRVTGQPANLANERLGVVLYPPDADNTGLSYERTVDMASASQATAFGYTAELKVPAAAIRPLVRGEIWRVKFFRNPDGSEADVTYPLEIAEPKLTNGSFEALGENGLPTSWSPLNNSSVELVDRPGGQHALKLKYISQGLSGLRSFGTESYVRTVRVSFRAWGEGKVTVSLIRYLDTPDPDDSSKTIRTMPKPYVAGGTYTVTDVPRYYTGTCQIPAGEWVTLYLMSSNGSKTADITIDDVSMTEEESDDP